MANDKFRKMKSPSKMGNRRAADAFWTNEGKNSRGKQGDKPRRKDDRR